MERRDATRRGTLASLSLGLGLLVLGAIGCRHTRPEVPPERPYVMPGTTTTSNVGPGSAAPHVGFSSEPPAGAYANAAGLPSSSGANVGSNSGYGAAPPVDLGLGGNTASTSPYSGPAPAILGDPGIKPVSGFPDSR